METETYISHEPIEAGDVVTMGYDRGRWRGVFKTDDPTIAFGIAKNSASSAECFVTVETALSKETRYKLSDLKDDLDKIKRADFLDDAEKEVKQAQVMKKIRDLIKAGV